MEQAYFGGGCFWCVEAVIQRLKGVDSIRSGYSGGATKDPTYKAITTGTTGHAEIVEVSFDPEILGYDQLLKVFMTTHDPTTLNRQGADKGTQYRSVIFYADDKQRISAEKVIADLQGYYEDTIVTQVQPLDTFYEAEQYHQNYYNRNSYAPYCRFVIDPKIAKLRGEYSHLLKDEV